MSEAVKVDEPVVATDAAPVLAAEPTVEAPAAVEAAPETAAVEATEPAAEATEPAAAAVEEVKPVEEGVLGYKGPGLLKYVFACHHPFPPQLYFHSQIRPTVSGGHPRDQNY